MRIQYGQIYFNHAYSIDKIDILSNLSPKDLISRNDISVLNHHCNFLRIKRASNRSKWLGFNSIITCTVPNQRFFKLLLNYNLGRYKFSNIELAKDIFYGSEDEAKFASYKMMQHLYKRYTKDVRIDDYRGSCHSTRETQKRGLFSEITGYFGDKIQFVVYARYSKVTGECCVHTEFSIIGSRNISQKLNLEHIEDLVEFDIGNNFELLYQFYIKMEGIDTVKLGKWLAGCTRQKVFSRRKLMKVHLHAIHLLSSEEITSIAQLANWLSTSKAMIKIKPGPKTEWEKKILSLRSCHAFSKPIEL